MTEERETEIVTGTVAGVTLKGEKKWQIEVQTIGSQYTKKLWTKSQDQHDLASSLIGQQATFECGISHWTNSSGAPVKSLWVNAINPGQLPEQNTSQDGGSAPRQQATGDPRQDSIERQTALKAAVEHHCTRPPATPGDVLETAALFAAFIRNGPPAATEHPTAALPTAPLPVDEDIPF